MRPLRGNGLDVQETYLLRLAVSDRRAAADRVKIIIAKLFAFSRLRACLTDVLARQRPRRLDHGTTIAVAALVDVAGHHKGFRVITSGATVVGPRYPALNIDLPRLFIYTSAIIAIPYQPGSSLTDEGRSGHVQASVH